MEYRTSNEPELRAELINGMVAQFVADFMHDFRTEVTIKNTTVTVDIMVFETSHMRDIEITFDTFRWGTPQDEFRVWARGTQFEHAQISDIQNFAQGLKLAHQMVTFVQSELPAHLSE